MDKRLRGIDILGLVFASLCLFEMGVALLIRNSLGRILQDMHVNLPLVTTFMFNRSAIGVVGLAPMALIVEGVLRRRSEENQVVRCVVAIIAMITLLLGIASLIHSHSQIMAFET